MSLNVLKGARCSPANATRNTLHRPPVAALIPPLSATQYSYTSYNTLFDFNTDNPHWRAVAQHPLTCTSTSKVVDQPAGSVSEDTFLLKLRQERVAEAVQQFESICALGVYPSNNSCQRLIAGLCKRRRFQEAWRAFVAIEGSNVRLNSQVAHMLVKFCLTKHKPAYALRIYHSYLRSTNTTANTFLATTLISHLLKLPDKATPHKDTALQLWQQLLSSNQPLDAPAYRAGINLHVELGRIRQAEQLLSTMQASGIAATTHSYNILLKYYCQRGDITAAQKLFKRMRSLSISPDSITYNTLMQAFVAAGEPVRARAVLDKARREGVAVDVVSYTCLLRGLANGQQEEAAEQLLVEMQQQGKAPNAVTWGTLANMYAQMGKVDSVRGVLHRMQQQGLQPNVVIYNTLLKALLSSSPTSSSSSSSAEDVSQLLRDMARQGISPGVDSYTTLIDALLQLPDPGSAARVFESLLQQGLQPDGVLLTCLMKLHVASGQPLAAIKAFNQISSSPAAAVDLPAWCALVDALASSGRMAEAEQASERVLEYAEAHALGVQACQPAFGALVKGYYWQRELDSGLRVFRRFLQLGGKPHAAMCGYIVQLCAAAGQYRTARQVVRATELMGVVVDRQRLEEVLRRYQQRQQQQQQQQQQERRGGDRDGGKVVPADGDGLERWKWWLGLPNKYYSEDWR